MDVIIPFGIKYKKCSKKSYSDFKKQQLIPYLEKNLIEKNTEVMMGIIAEIHSSSYYADLHAFIISFYANNLLLNLSIASFIDVILQKFSMISEMTKKKYRNEALINSNEIRNIYSSIFIKFIEGKQNKLNVRLEKNCNREEVYLLHCNLTEFPYIEDDNHTQLSLLMSRGIREILFFLKMEIDILNTNINLFINRKNVEKIVYWLLWLLKIESIEKKYVDMNYKITSKYGALIGKKMSWILFIWDKIWQKCEKNNYINKPILKTLTNLFYYKKEDIKNRAGIVAVALLISLSPIKINISRKISKLEIFTSLNVNQFYKNINIDSDNDKHYLELYNEYHNKQDTKEVMKISHVENKMDFLNEYLPKVNQKSTNNKTVLDYFSKK
jgi:hypothetical protein